MHVLHKFLGFLLGLLQPSSPTAKELHGQSFLIELEQNCMLDYT